MRPFGPSKSVNDICAEVVVPVGLFAALVLLLLVSPSTSRAATIHPMPLSRALRAVAAPTVPSEWAGIWSFADTIRDCIDPRIVTPLNVGLDTLCAGAAYGPDSMQFVCSGGFTDTGFDFTCTGTQSVHANCSLAITSHLQGTRNGDVVTTFRQSMWVYTPTDCDGFPDGCVVTAGIMTYVGPPPTDCATTPARTSSWGSLKRRYR